MSRDVSGVTTSNRRDAIILMAVAVAMTAILFIFRAADGEPEPAASSDAAIVHGDMDQAMAGATDFPTEYEPLALMGNDMMDQGAYAMAAECYRRALELHEDADVRVDFGVCLHGMGLSARAIEEFQRVLTEHPDHGIAAFNIGVVYHNDKELDSAKTYFERYLAAEPDGRAAESARRFLEEPGP